MRPYTKTVYASGALSSPVAILATAGPTASGAVAEPTDFPDGRSLTNDLPLTSAMVISNLSTSRLTCAQRDQWAQDNLPSRVQVALATPFGKDSLLHTFSAAVKYRHVLLFVFKSGFLDVCTTQALLQASPLARRLDELIARYGAINFTPLQNGIPANLPTPTLLATTQSLVTACLLHYNFDTPTVARYIGGQHITAHRDVPAILKELQWARVDSAVLADLERIYTIGSRRCATPLPPGKPSGHSWPMVTMRPLVKTSPKRRRP
jgi:hypothetical protein